MNTEMPYYGRAWIYRALSRSVQTTRLAPQDRRLIKLWLVRGVEAEPGSAWAYYVAAETLLEAGPLSDAEKAMVLTWLQKAAQYAPPPRHRRARVHYDVLAAELTAKYFGKGIEL